MCSPWWDERQLAPALAAAFAIIPATAAATAALAAIETEVSPAAAAATVAATATAGAAAEAAAPAAAVAATAAGTSAVAAATGTATVAAGSTTTAATREGARLGLEAVTAVHRTIATWLEWNFGLFAARCAGRIEHLPWRTAIGESAAFTSAHCALPCLAAVRTAPGLTRKALRRMKLLFTRGEHERLAAVAADERLVGVRHPMTLLNLRGTYGHRAPVEFE